MSSGLTFGTIKRVVAILIAIAIVLAAGLVVFQAPALFGVETDPEASITFEDQQGTGENVTIAEVSLSDGGFVVITDGGDEPLAVSEYLEAGTHENVTVERSEDTEADLVGQLTATVHQDTDDDGSYTYEESDGEEDRPYLEDGFPVSDAATVTAADEEPLTDSFLVESIEAPESATTNETIEVVAEITNPTAYDTQQNVEFRLDGTVLERRVLELSAGESRNVTFTVDTSGTPPGNRTLGVYTNADGELARIDLEFHTEPAIEVVNASDDAVTVEVATPVDGFVGIEYEDGRRVGTSEALEPGEHSNVTVEFGENVTVEEDDQLTAVLYEGDPDDPDAASPFEGEDGNRVETTFTLADARAEDESGGGDDDAGSNETDESGGGSGNETDG